MDVIYDKKNMNEYKEVFVDKVYAKFSPKDKVVVDVGATAGEYALWAVSEGAKFVYAFEPNINSYKRMVRNITANNYTSKIQPFGIALGDGDYLMGEWKGDWFVKGTNNFTKIPANKLDVYGIRDIDLIKIDVEGFELEVLKGAVNVIKNFHPQIIVEISDDDLGKVYDFLRGLGYYLVDKVQNSYSPKVKVYFFEYKDNIGEKGGK